MYEARAEPQPTSAPQHVSSHNTFFVHCREAFEHRLGAEAALTRLQDLERKAQRGGLCALQDWAERQMRQRVQVASLEVCRRRHAKGMRRNRASEKGRLLPRVTFFLHNRQNATELAFSTLVAPPPLAATCAPTCRRCGRRTAHARLAPRTCPPCRRPRPPPPAPPCPAAPAPAPAREWRPS